MVNTGRRQKPAVARLLIHFSTCINGTKTPLCYVQWYELVSNTADSTSMLQVKARKPDDGGVEIIPPQSIIRGIHLIPNFLIEDEDVRYVNWFIDPDAYSQW